MTINFPTTHRWHNAILEELEAAAEDGLPRPFFYLENLGSYAARMNYVARARRFGRFRHGLEVGPEDIITLSAPSLDSEVKHGELALRQGAVIRRVGPVAEQVDAMWDAAAAGQAKWPGSVTDRNTEYLWNKRNGYSDFRRADGLITYEPKDAA